MSSEEEQKAAVEQMRQGIVERFIIPEDGYKSLDSNLILESFSMADNAANRSLIEMALEAADIEAAKYSKGGINISNPEEAAAYLKSMGIRRRKK